MSAGYAGAVGAGRLRVSGSRSGLLGAACALVLSALSALVFVLGSGSGTPASEIGSSTVASQSALASDSGAFAPLPGTPARTVGAPERSALQHAYGRLPLSFEQNRGQFDRRAAFVARGSGYTLFLTKRSAVLSLAAGASRGHSRRARRRCRSAWSARARARGSRVSTGSPAR